MRGGQWRRSNRATPAPVPASDDWVGMPLDGRRPIATPSDPVLYPAGAAHPFALSTGRFAEGPYYLVPVTHSYPFAG